MFLHIPRRKTSLSFYPWRHGDVIEGIIIDINKDVFCFFNPGKQINIIFFLKKGWNFRNEVAIWKKTHTHVHTTRRHQGFMCLLAGIYNKAEKQAYPFSRRGDRCKESKHL